MSSRNTAVCPIIRRAGEDKTMFSTKGIPLYYQTENYIREKILNGEWEVGSRIPTELQLMEMFQISRATLRQAISDLVNEGILERCQGKGTFVRRRLAYNNDPTIIWVKPVEGIRHRIVSVEHRPTPTKINKFLKLENSAEATVFSYLHCLLDEDNSPYNLSVTYFLDSLFPDIQEHFFKDTLYNVVKNVYHISLEYAVSNITAIDIDKKIAKILGTAAGIPAVEVSKVYYDRMDRPILVTEMYMHPHNSKLQVRTMP